MKGPAGAGPFPPGVAQELGGAPDTLFTVAQIAVTVAGFEPLRFPS